MDDDDLDLLLPSSLVADRAFRRYLLKVPELYVDVSANLHLFQQGRASTHYELLWRGRNAAYTLFVVAQEGDFEPAARVFYSYYEYFCLKLLNHYPEVRVS